jgi:hypothetical protein
MSIKSAGLMSLIRTFLYSFDFARTLKLAVTGLINREEGLDGP